GINSDRVGRAVVAKSPDLALRNPMRRLSFGQPLVHHSGKLRRFTNKDEHWWSWVFAILRPRPCFFLPQASEHSNRMMRVFENRLGLRIGALATALGRRQLLFQNP